MTETVPRYFKPENQSFLILLFSSSPIRSQILGPVLSNSKIFPKSIHFFHFPYYILPHHYCLLWISRTTWDCISAHYAWNSFSTSFPKRAFHYAKDNTTILLNPPQCFPQRWHPEKRRKPLHSHSPSPSSAGQESSILSHKNKVRASPTFGRPRARHSEGSPGIRGREPPEKPAWPLCHHQAPSDHGVSHKENRRQNSCAHRGCQQQAPDQIGCDEARGHGCGRGQHSTRPCLGGYQENWEHLNWVQLANSKYNFSPLIRKQKLWVASYCFENKIHSAWLTGYSGIRVLPKSSKNS